MKTERSYGWNRRDFVRGLTLAGTAGLVGLRPGAADADPPPETTKLRLFQGYVACIAPQYVAKELLHSEGFTDVRYLKNPTETQKWAPEVLLSGEVDISLSFVPSDIMHIEAGAPVVILGGSHIGCIELVGGNRVRSTPDLKGRTVSIARPRSDDQIFISMFAAHVGLDPQKDINWVIHPYVDNMRLLTEEKIDAFMSGPPFSLELREKKIGHVLANTTTDKPWSQYFCCLVASSREFVRTHPVATKRALRAIAEERRRVCPRAESSRTTHGRQRPGSPLRLRPPDAQGDPVRQVARVRSRGFGAVLRAADARGRNDQEQPTEDRRSGHRLAFPERTEEGTEGMISRRAFLHGMMTR